MARRDQLKRGLERLGCREVVGRTRKYTVMQARNPDTRYYLGASGALRIGSTVGDSISLTGTKLCGAIMQIGNANWKIDTVEQARDAMDSILAAK